MQDRQAVTVGSPADELVHSVVFVHATQSNLNELENCNNGGVVHYFTKPDYVQAVTQQQQDEQTSFEGRLLAADLLLAPMLLSWHTFLPHPHPRQQLQPGGCSHITSTRTHDKHLHMCRFTIQTDAHTHTHTHTHARHARTNTHTYTHIHTHTHTI